MNKSELIEAMANTASLSKKDAEAALNAYTDVITEALKKGDKVTLVGFGTYETRAARLFFPAARAVHCRLKI